VDLAAVLDTCARAGTAIGISGDPHRLDLPEEWHGAARKSGVKTVLLADAHDLVSVDQAILAVGSARRGGWRRGEVLNTMDAQAFLDWCRGKTSRART
jgi:DNA polymerase (family 10)